MTEAAPTSASRTPVKPSEHRRRTHVGGVSSTLTAILALYSFIAAYGAAPVEESVAEDVARPANNPPAPAMEQPPPGTSRLGQLFYELQLLRDEVQRLNGAIEEQQNQIERLAREQHERYLGLDRRIAELSGPSAREREGFPRNRQQREGFPRNRQQREGEPLARRQPPSDASEGTLLGGREPFVGAQQGGPLAGTQPSDVPEREGFSRSRQQPDGGPLQGSQPSSGEGTIFGEPAADDGAGVATAPSGQREPTTERGTYESAFDMMQRQQYVAATEVFQRLIDEYPNGQYTPNAFYWLGDLHRKNGDPEAARQSFALVVNLYPDHHKVPDALFKLGVVYAQLDEPDRAMEYLERVIREYPDSTAASLAEDHAAELR